MSSISLSALSAATSRVLNLLTQPTELASSPTLLYLSFNQDRGCFTVGTTSGFRIYECNPLGEIFRGDDLPPSLPPIGTTTGGGGTGIVKMVFRCNLLALVGGGPKPQYPHNKVIIWDHRKLQCVRTLPFGTEVKSIRLRMDSIVIVFLQKILIYEFPILKLEHEIETFLNPSGLCEVSQTWGSWVLACPGLQKGGIRVEHYGSNVTKYIMMAHDSSIACLSLTDDGRFLATASSKGTLIRVFNTLNGSLLKEVRRGADRAEIYSLAFNSTAQWLAASSSKGTIHVFNLRLDHASLTSGTSDGASEPDNSSPLAVSNLSFVKGFLPKYFSSEWSVAQFHLQEGLQSIVGFGIQKYTVMIHGMDGSFYRCQFDPETGGEMTQLEHHNFL